MKILLIGASGTLGQAVHAELGASHDIVTVGKNSGDYRADITQDASVKALFESVGRVDAIISTAGKLFFGPLSEMSTEQFDIGLQDKLLGQVRLALIGQHYLNDGGSITLTAGTLSLEPIRQGANATTVNAALEGFARGAAVDLQRGLRINVISPTLLNESKDIYGAFFAGFETISASRAALAYRRSVEGAQTGQVYRIG